MLFLKFMLLNLAGAALLVAAAMQGWIAKVIEGDQTLISEGIAGVFFLGLVICGAKIWWISREFSRLHDDKSLAGNYTRAVKGRSAGARSTAADLLKSGLFDWAIIVRQFANSLVILGMIGTVVGFVIALSGVDAESARDVSQVSGMVGTLVNGMSVALYTTLVGAVLSLWLTVNFNMLAAGVKKLANRVIERGEMS
jgi:hypothetical protein